MRRKRTIEEKFILFSGIEECAAAAAPVFQANRWRWTDCGIPSQHEIEETLRYPQTDALDECCGTGRLIYYKGQFGYQRPKAEFSNE